MKKGDLATIIFNMGGHSSEDKYPVLEITDNEVRLETDEDWDKCYRFDLRNGKCLNDNDAFGASRQLKI